MKKLDDLQQINTNIPRETLVFLADNLVIKRPVNKKDKNALNIWLDKQLHAKKISDSVLAVHNKKYFIPRTLEISTNEYFSVEERVFGNPITSSFFETLTPEEIDIIYQGFAHFINDINQSKQVLSQRETFDISTSVKHFENISIKEIIIKLQKYISKEDLQIVQEAKDWFDVASDSDASVVFSHGDMNEHNIFFNKETRVLSIIDFADSKYQTADYMFNVDLARLGWLDIERLKKEYEKIPKKQKVTITTKPEVKNMRNLLYNFKIAACEFLHNPKLATKIRVQIINQEIEKIKKLYNKILDDKEFKKGIRLLQSESEAEIIKAQKNDKHR